MPALVSKHVVRVYDHASKLPASVWEAFRLREREANVMYPHALKSRLYDGAQGPQFWLTCSSYIASNDDRQTLDLVLSCTEGAMGSFPIFIFVNTSPRHLSPEWLRSRLDAMIQRLLGQVDASRVFSVFAPEPVTREFAQMWMYRTNIGFYSEPYYAAKLTYCTPTTITRRRMTVFPDLGYVPRLAEDKDLHVVAELCRGFAATSEPFTLTEQKALKEARYLIKGGLVWVLEVHRPGQPSDLASLVAVTRTSSNVSGITKVYTNPRWRKRGCAERLVRHVCQQLLATKAAVVLYVAHNNPAAAGVYHRVGFQGLTDSKARVDGVESWLELGFDRDYVQLGHW
ncbi:hypothetical protein PENSPDRAFT_673129 [Peniophora sp. CONT]|nr:hypothetical protein PENSPDRAFT_673129 [Peniophora sp. CONT]